MIHARLNNLLVQLTPIRWREHPCEKEIKRRNANCIAILLCCSNINGMSNNRAEAHSGATARLKLTSPRFTAGPRSPFKTHRQRVPASAVVVPARYYGKLRSRFPRILRKPGFLPVVYHYNAALFLRSSTVITADYCPGGHLPCINKAEERWRQVATLTPTARLDVEESRFRSVGATVRRSRPTGRALREYHKGIARSGIPRGGERGALPGRDERVEPYRS